MAELYTPLKDYNIILSYDTEDKMLYLRSKGTDDELGAFYGKQRINNKSFDKLTINSAELKSLANKFETHKDLKNYDTKKAKVALNESLDDLVMQYMDWLDDAEERRKQERLEAEQERQLELEEINSDTDTYFEDIDNILPWIVNTINWFTAGESMNILYAWLSYCSQIILDEPISVIGKGEANSGKSHILETALDLLPSEYVLKMKGATTSATYGLAEQDPWFFDKKIVYIGDMGGADDHKEVQEFKNMMKELQTDGEVKRVKQVKDPETNDWTPKWFELYGHPCLTYTQVPGYIHEGQELSRSVILTPRTDNNRAVGILKNLYKMKDTPSTHNIQKYRERIPMIRNLVLLLRSRMEYSTIYNPYQSFIDNFLNSSKFFKRDYDKYTGILEVITAINGYRREMYNGTVLFTTPEDIQYFLKILETYKESIQTNLSPSAMDILREMRENADKWDLYDDQVGFTVTDYMYRSQKDLQKHSFQSYFSELNGGGFIRTIGKEGQQNLYMLTNKVNDELDVPSIELDETDVMMLEYNFPGYEPYIEKSLQRSPEEFISLYNGSDLPFWNRMLPEYKQFHGSSDSKIGT